ncbi:MAG: S8 family serine peptidase [Chloroflexota bacterium]|nr:S8 family serine peptidase [Chloroflexota bacterium]
MRCSIVGPGADKAVREVGGENVRPMPRVGVVFADLSDGQTLRLISLGFHVRPVQDVSIQQVTAPPAPPHMVGPSLTGEQILDMSRFTELVASLDPPITGRGIGVTICILDSGIRETHEGLRGKVVYTENFSNSPTPTDLFDHGTGVAWMAAGGVEDAAGFRGYASPQGFAPGCWLMNMKVLDDDGTSTEEVVVAALERVAQLWEQYPPVNFPRGYSPEPMRPNIVNLSLGSPDTGDPYNPVRVACRALDARNIGVVAAAGNVGPDPQTITNPAVEATVLAVGSVDTELQVPEWSSRGPTREGLIKPDVSFFGVNLVTASAKSDTAYRNVSGTSFSCGAASGGVAVLGELVVRAIGMTPLTSEVMGITPTITRKPVGAPSDKDNDWGWGVPYGDLVVQQLQRLAPVAAMGNLMDLVSPVITLAMLGMMARAFTLRR